MDKKHLDYFMDHFYKEDLPPRELVGAAAFFERMYANTAQLIIGENNENSCSFCGAKWTIESVGNLLWPPSENKIPKYCPMCGRHFVTMDLDDVIKEEKEAEKYIQASLEFIRRNSTYGLNFEQGLHCGFAASGGHAYNCNDCPNKCDEWHQWDKEMKNDKDN